MARNEAETRADLIDPRLRDWGWLTGGEPRVSREFCSAHLSLEKKALSWVRLGQSSGSARSHWSKVEPQ